MDDRAPLPLSRSLTRGDADGVRDESRIVAHGRVVTVIALESDGARVRKLRAVGNPQKLSHVE